MEDKSKIILYQPEETFKLEVRLESDTVWLKQQQMAELFQTSKQNISLHTNNVFKEKELQEISTVKYSLTVQQEGNRKVKRNIAYYNLDVIISVGYRVKSQEVLTSEYGQQKSSKNISSKATPSTNAWSNWNNVLQRQKKR